VASQEWRVFIAELKLARGGAITDSELAHGGKEKGWVLTCEGKEKKRETRE